MSTPKIVISATGALCNLGNTMQTVAAGLETWPATSPAASSEFHTFESEIPCFRASGYNPVEVLGKKGLRLKDWATKLLLGTFEQEFKTILEGFTEETVPGICVGTAFGSVQSIGDFLSDSIVNGVNNVNPQLFANTVINSPTGNANIRYNVRTLSATMATGFNAGLDAIIYAADQIRQGYYQAIVAGGLDEISYYTLLGLDRSGVLSQSGTIRPFAADADGYVVGEGCGLVLLESEEHAKARGAAIIAELVGVANTFDRTVTVKGFGSSPEAATAAVQGACSMADIAPSALGMAAVSANGNRAGDSLEAQVLQKLLPDVPAAAYKAKTGECYGASGALNLVCALADASQRRISATCKGYALPDGVNLLESNGDLQKEHILVNAFSCDGNCSSVVLKIAQ